MSGTGHCSAKSSSSCSSKLLLSSSLYRTRSRNDGDRAMQRRCGASASTSGPSLLSFASGYKEWGVQRINLGQVSILMPTREEKKRVATLPCRPNAFVNAKVSIMAPHGKVGRWRALSSRSQACL
ncbi:hypothetical protein MUK42_21240 [Musa troglodytarum]|uniref:Uncharacterized protein n=2 Tax=Musa troglodytarum TaxID=320322 RepID=A0A9E7FPP1_9LILI|nr:hypothetical protein MUK42_21240 [Musa troglodytarum]